MSEEKCPVCPSCSKETMLIPKGIGGLPMDIYVCVNESCSNSIMKMAESGENEGLLLTEDEIQKFQKRGKKRKRLDFKVFSKPGVTNA